MNLELFKLRELPFRLSPDPQFLYLSKAHARAKAYMESTVWFADGFVVITGEIGCGKTTLIETFLQELQNDVIVAQINQTQVSSLEFLQSVLVQFGFKPFKMKKAELLATLNDYLVDLFIRTRSTPPAEVVLDIDASDDPAKTSSYWCSKSFICTADRARCRGGFGGSRWRRRNSHCHPRSVRGAVRRGRGS